MGTLIFVALIAFVPGVAKTLLFMLLTLLGVVFLLAVLAAMMFAANYLLERQARRRANR